MWLLPSPAWSHSRQSPPSSREDPPMLALVVTSPFAEYQRGDQITDPARIAKIREAGQDANTVPIEVPDIVPEQQAGSQS